MSLTPVLMPRTMGADGQLHDAPPVGELVAGLQVHPLQDQELAPDGTTVRRRRFQLRGFDGEVLAWTGRERVAGGHAGSIPLAFDQASSPGDA